MASGITSTVRPTGLRLAGTACVALGAIAAGVGATREWATIGFKADLQHAADVSVHGIDVWEGKFVLFAAVATLLVMLAMRISGSRGTRRGLAIALIVLGALCVALPVPTRSARRTASAASRAWTGSRRRFRCSSAPGGRGTRAPQGSARGGPPRRDLGGLWITVAGGVLLVAGGILGLVWVRRDGANATVPVERDPG
jgi:hypothetical protein